MKRLTLTAPVVALLALLAQPFPAAHALGAPPAGGEVPGPRALSAFGLGDTTARGLVSGVDFFVPLAFGTTAVAPSRLDLDISHSSLLLPDLSTLTVSTNGQAVTSVRLDSDTASHGRVAVPLPVLASPATGYAVSVQFGMRLTRDTCEDPNNPALWATVHSDSTVTLATAVIAGSRTLSNLPELLAPSGAALPSTQVVLPQSPSAADLETAGDVAWALGRWASAAHRDPVLGVARGTATAAPAVEVGRGSGTAVAQDGPLVVTVADAAAARALSAPSAAAPAPSAWSQSAASFAQLGYDVQAVGGRGARHLFATFERPAGWDIDQGAYLDLVLDASPALRAETSSVRVSVDGQALGASQLRAGVNHYRFDLPAGLLSSRLDGRPVRALDLDALVYLDLPQAACTPVPIDAASVGMLPQSSWYLPHHDVDTLDTGRFPAGFRPASTVVVLPDQPQDADLLAALETVAAMGRWTASGPPPRLVTAGSLREGDRGRSDLVLIGTADAALGHRIDDPGGGSCSLVIARSPYGGGRTALAIHGESAELPACAEALAVRSVLDRLQGRAVALDAAGTVSAELGAVPGETSPPELTPQIRRSWLDAFPYRPVIAGLLLVAFVVVVGLVGYRRYGRR